MLAGQHGSVAIEVIDNGVGISAENQSKLFRLFGYLESTKEINSNGIGLGLYITKMIVKQFGGQVSVDSSLGRGSTFRMEMMMVEQVNENAIQRTLNPNRQQQQLQQNVA